MLIMNWTKDETGRISATWIKNAESVYQPLSLQWAEAEPTVTHFHPRTSGGTLAAMWTRRAGASVTAERGEGR
ncbi:MAG TPA: hypothetical protein VKU00_23935 [Chthonomonadaceae bacterium]|nr:hypothetical protein [Chthonomonadaceae bacterium]